MDIYAAPKTQVVMQFPTFVIVRGFTDFIFNAVLKVMFVEFMCSQRNEMSVKASTRLGAVEYEIERFFDIEKPKQGQPCLQKNKVSFFHELVYTGIKFYSLRQEL